MPEPEDTPAASDRIAVMEEALAAFTPKFRKLDDEPWDFAHFAARWATKNGKSEGFQPDSFGRIARSPAFVEKFIDLYFAAGRHDLVEADARIDEWGAELPHRDLRMRFHQFAALGHGVRGMRCWRHYIRKIARMYWESVRDRDAALKRAAKNAEAQTQADWEVEQTANVKLTLLEAYALAARFFEAYGGERDRAWLHATRAEVVAGKKQTLSGKPDPAPMTEDLFWQIVGEGGEDLDSRLETLPERLAAYAPKEIKMFGQRLLDASAAAYRADVWALAYLLMGGCSDDAFDYFRDWLILQGRDVYEAVLADPDAFDPATLTGAPLVEGLMEAVVQAHELRAGKDLPRLRQPKLKIKGKLDEAAFAAMLPRVAEKTA